jgi:2-polyprenyl-3-methyl-5-hydroxy-6-metoxy-1,4-benzoquinol methylase
LHLPLKFDTAPDFGCGVGRLTRQIIDKYKWVQAVDISENMLVLAGKNVLANQVNFLSWGILKNVSANSFDFIICLLTFQPSPKN